MSLVPATRGMLEIFHVGVRAPESVPDWEFVVLLQPNPVNPSAVEALPVRLRTGPLDCVVLVTAKLESGPCDV